MEGLKIKYIFFGIILVYFTYQFSSSIIHFILSLTSLYLTYKYMNNSIFHIVMSFLVPYFNIPYIFYMKEKSFEETSNHVKSVYKVLNKPLNEVFTSKLKEIKSLKFL